MFRKKVTAIQLLAWLFVALTAPAAQLLAGYNWIYVTAIGVACIAAVGVVLRITEEDNIPKWLAVVQALWLLVVIGLFSKFTGESWPMGKGDPVIPVVLLFLGCWSASKGAETAARVAGVLFFLMVMGYGLILSFGLSQTRWETLIPDSERIGWLAVIVLLTPAAAICIPRESLGRKKAWLLVLPIFTGTAAMIVGSVLPAEVCSGSANLIYEMSRSIQVLGIKGRLEALVCALVTVGWFSLTSFLFSGIGSAAEKILPGKAKIVLWCVLVVEVILSVMNVPIQKWIVAVMAIVIWIILPILVSGIEKIKKSKKVKKGIDKSGSK